MKRWGILALIVIVLVVVIGGLKAFGIYQMIQGFKAQGEPKFTVSTERIESTEWQPTLSAVGSLRAVRGVMLTTEVSGLVDKIRFRSGDEVKAGDVLLQLVDDSDIAAADALRATRDLARTVYARSVKQFDAQAISQAQLDSDKATLAGAEAQLAQQEALVAKKTIRAPFAGRLGISTVNPGQYLNPGDAVVPLQQLDPIYVDFSLPQQALASLKVGAPLRIAVDAFAGESFEGSISAVDPIVDADTRNIRVQATVRNPQRQLLPGMFATVALESGSPQQYLTLPQTAITYNPYGETVFVVIKRGDAGKLADNKPADLREHEAIDAANAKLNAKAEASKAADAPPGDADVLVAHQVFVKVGATRGGQIAILDGLKAGDEVVTSGQLKLKNGAAVVINNTVQPPSDPAPQPVDQ
ncbi:efflux RND transporter periplasmic adaptor subunit [Solimonas soli]|uniref:efflux RND transporter periplasmic adaptor subunit n=1 Tax=Solimonas soli TaxID=413479 RepID=UPI0004B2CE08|nr:efflux RND transporter periplasmic adaptor subunit [Solimonas soli]